MTTHARLDWLKPSGKPLHVLLTKADKLGKQLADRTLSAVASQLAHEYRDSSVQLFSSTRKIGIVEAAAQIQTWLSDGTNKKPPVKGE